MSLLARCRVIKQKRKSVRTPLGNKGGTHLGFAASHETMSQCDHGNEQTTDIPLWWWWGLRCLLTNNEAIFIRPRVKKLIKKKYFESSRSLILCTHLCNRLETSSFVDGTCLLCLVHKSNTDNSLWRWPCFVGCASIVALSLNRAKSDGCHKSSRRAALGKAFVFGIWFWGLVWFSSLNPTSAPLVCSLFLVLIFKKKQKKQQQHALEVLS